MATSNRSTLHNALGVTDGELASIRQIKTVWTQLETLGRKADKSDRDLPAYQAYLEKCLAQVRSQVVYDADTDVLLAKSKELSDYYVQQMVVFDINEHETTRWPTSHTEWLERHMPAEWKAYGEVVAKWVTAPTPQHFTDMKEAIVGLLKAYVAAVPRH